MSCSNKSSEAPARGGRRDRPQLQRLIVAGGSVLVLATALSSFAHHGDEKQAEEDAGSCVTYPTFKLCSNLETTLKKLKPNQTKKWTIRVEGTREPVRVRLYNSSPSIVRVKGGPIVRTSGGRRNTKKIKVKGLREGSARLTVLQYYDDPALESQNIADVLSAALNELAETFAEQAGDWIARAEAGKAGKKDARRLLSSTETSLLELLSAFDELAALGDYTAERFRQAREELDQRPSPQRTSWRTAPPTRVVFADLRRPSAPAYVQPAQARRPDPALEPGKSALGLISALFARIKELVSANDLVTDLCVRTVPEDGARFLMRPLSFADWTQDTLTAARLVSVYRGLYAYRINKKGHKPASCDKNAINRAKCAALDLVDDDRPGLDCDLQARACRRQAGGC